MEFSGITDPWLRKNLERMDKARGIEDYREHIRVLLWELNNQQKKSDAEQAIIKELLTKLEKSVAREQYDRDVNALTKICELQNQLIGELRQRSKAYEMHPTEVAILNWLAQTTPFCRALDGAEDSR